MSDWKERMERIEAANKGEQKPARQLSIKGMWRQKKRVPQTGEKVVVTHAPLCDMCGKKTARRNILKQTVGAHMMLCTACNKTKQKR